jgi:hypothetical protein
MWFLYTKPQEGQVGFASGRNGRFVPNDGKYGESSVEQ